MIKEAQRYINLLTNLQNGIEPRELENSGDDFWNRIMEEHAMAIRGLLDLTEKNLFREANDFARVFAGLSERNDMEMIRNLENTLEETMQFINFKAHITRGIIECKVKAITSPLFTDHLLREAYHYLRLLRSRNR